MDAASNTLYTKKYSAPAEVPRRVEQERAMQQLTLYITAELKEKIERQLTYLLKDVFRRGKSVTTTLSVISGVICTGRGYEGVARQLTQFAKKGGTLFIYKDDPVAYVELHQGKKPSRKMELVCTIPVPAGTSL